MVAHESLDAALGEDCELVRAESELDIVKRVADPRLPSESEVKTSAQRPHPLQGLVSHLRGIHGEESAPSEIGASKECA